MAQAIISRAALGKMADLGELYDARKDIFCGISIFTKSPAESTLTHRNNPLSELQFVLGDTLKEKFSKLDVSAELSVSILAGLFNPEGCGHFLNDQKSSARSVKSSLIYNIHTKSESVDIYGDDLQGSFSMDAIQSGVATHVVVGISWGANSVISCEYLNTEDREITELEGSLSATLKTLSLGISGKASVNFGDGDNDDGTNFTIRVYGDVLPRGQELPTTISGALSLMKQIPELVATCNDGRGVPLKYQLIPLSQLRSVLDFEMKADLVVTLLRNDSIVRVVQLFEKLSESKQRLNDFRKEVTMNKFAISDLDFAKVSSLVETFNVDSEKFRAEFGNVLTAIRGGEMEAMELEKLTTRFESSPCSPISVDRMLTELKNVKEKITSAKTLMSTRVTFIGDGNTLDDEIIKGSETKTFVLFINEACKTQDAAGWHKNRQIFLQELIKYPDFKFIAVDCDIHPRIWPTIGVSIQVSQNGKILTHDLVKDQEKSILIPLAKYTLYMQHVIQRPDQRVNLIIPCTGRNCDPTEEYEWQCHKCKQGIEYGFDNFFYCDCGKGHMNMFEFKCPHPDHGIGFERYDEKCMADQISRLSPLKEMNILILGETGVGKSTWINGFINFLTFESLEEAEKNELCTLIHSEFTVCDEDYNEIKVTTGTDENEIHKRGASATQESKVYTFNIGDTLIRLIDTPGIGDTRGVKQDKANFQNILSTLSYLKELHGICILLKPNNARLTVMFRFCIKELLTYLHRDASQNIMFCFTNSRGTFYRPGDTMPALKELLEQNKEVLIPISKKTVYCFDSEAYRFLAALKNVASPVKFADVERNNFATSWEKSIIETKRMLAHISTLPPHPIQSTLNLNHVRELVVQLTRPLAEISKTIHTNRKVIKDHLEEITLTNENLKDLQAKRFCDQIELEITEVSNPKTVCTNSKCTSIYGNAQFKQIDYRTVCHNPCKLSGVIRDTVGDPELMRCAAMKNGFCIWSKCGHHYKEHMHIYYDSNEVIKQIESETVKQQIHDNTSASELKQRMIEEQERRIMEQNYELQVIEGASVKFAAFLKRNAITPYNDAMLDYLEHLISVEKDKVKVGGTDKMLEEMETSLAIYKEQVKILDEAMDRGENTDILKPQGVNELVQHLYKLKNYGKTISNSLKAVQISGANISRYQEVASKYKPSVRANKKNPIRRFTYWVMSGIRSFSGGFD